MVFRKSGISDVSKICGLFNFVRLQLLLPRRTFLRLNTTNEAFGAASFLVVSSAKNGNATARAIKEYRALNHGSV